MKYLIPLLLILALTGCNRSDDESKRYQQSAPSVERTTAPEPMTILLVGSGMVALLLQKRRKL